MDTMNTDSVKSALKAKKPKAKPMELLSTGSTLLNLACSGDAEGGYPKGGYVFFVGDSMSGKTWFSLTCMAEAVRNKAFQNYRFIYDNVERGARMDFARYFGQTMADKVEAPAYDENGNPIYSSYTEEFYFRLDTALRDGRPFIWVEDSMDSLDTFADDDKFGEWKKAFEDGKETKGSFGMAKAKINSTTIRTIPGRLAETGSILIIISQTRDNVDPRNPFQTKTRSGGRALRFYATLEIWSSVVGRIKRMYKGKDRQIGVNVKLQVQKNRIIGKESEVTVPIYHSMGIDDIGSCVDYLVLEKEWGKTKGGVITATGIGPDKIMKREKLVSYIEENGLVEDVRDLVGGVWGKIEDAVAVKRMNRYE